ncbi:unnamed protein product [Alopecurus aequalis]
MDSGNSGSLQSSSGGDDDFDSRGGGVDSSPLSALLRPAPSPSAAGAYSLHGSLYGLQDFTSGPPQHQQQQHQQSPWSAQFMPGAASSSQRVAPADAGMGGGSAHQASDPSAAAAPAPAPPRGSRKRARASRRAPTTVLTTDTSNFRAMVQEFTGIPNPPFAAGAVGPGASFNSRFDHIFSSSSALRSAADPASSLPPYLLRPFAQKLQTAAPSPFAPFTSPSSSTPASANIGGPNANVNATAGAATAASANQRAAAGDDFHLPSSALLRMQQDQSSSYLSFQNLLGSTQPMSQHMFGGMSHGAPRLHEQSPSQLLSSVGSGGIGLAHGGMMISEGMHMHQHQQRNDVHQGGGDELSGVVRAGASGSGSGSCKLNYTSHAGASSSSAAGSTEAPPDGASRPSRGEGLDPWLCTSE